MNDIEELIKDFTGITVIKEIDFKKVCGFYFAVETAYIIIKDEISSSEIKPVAIIYEENDQYYLAEIDGTCQTEEVVKNFVEKCLKK